MYTRSIHQPIHPTPKPNHAQAALAALAEEKAKATIASTEAAALVTPPSVRVCCVYM